MALQLAAWRAGITIVSVELDQPVVQIEARVRAASPDLLVRDVDAAPFGIDGITEASIADIDASVGVGAVGQPTPAPDVPAWGCFTSGSTGVPDLVLGTQHQLAHLVHGWHAAVPPEAVGVATVSKPVSGIGYVSEWLVPLLAGASVVVLDAVTVRDPFRTARRLRDHEVTWFRGTPALLDALARYLIDRGEPNRRVRFVVSGGDTLTRRTADLLAQAFPAAVIANQYGCTEGTSESALGPVRPGSTPPDVGRSLTNALVEVVGPAGRLQPPGVVGEIALGGPMVAGTRDADGRCRTGDHGWWDSEGRLHFTGRIDRRLSINGNHVEAGEIETALRSTSLVRDTLVTVDPSDGRRLAALVVAERPTTPVEVRRAVGERLPRHAVPARVVVVEALPLTAAGKPDLGQMAAWLADRDEVVPDVGMTEAVADVRAAVALTLRRPVETVDTRASLIDNGGDSFAAIELAERLHGVTGQPVDVVDLLGDRPLAELADSLAATTEAVELPGRLRHVAAGVRPGTVIWFPGGAGFDVEVRRLSHYLPSARACSPIRIPERKQASNRS